MRPEQELKGFQKVFLEAGKKSTVQISLDTSAFAYYHPEKKGWIAEKGDFEIRVGTSSHDIHMKDWFRLKKMIEL